MLTTQDSPLDWLLANLKLVVFAADNLNKHFRVTLLDTYFPFQVIILDKIGKKINPYLPTFFSFFFFFLKSQVSCFETDEELEPENFLWSSFNGENNIKSFMKKLFFETCDI